MSGSSQEAVEHCNGLTADVSMSGNSQEAVEHCNGLTAQWQIGAHVALENIHGTEMGFCGKATELCQFLWKSIFVHVPLFKHNKQTDITVDTVLAHK
jgi:hypothetical protein